MNCLLLSLSVFTSLPQSIRCCPSIFQPFSIPRRQYYGSCIELEWCRPKNHYCHCFNIDWEEWGSPATAWTSEKCKKKKIINCFTAFHGGLPPAEQRGLKGCVCLLTGQSLQKGCQGLLGRCWPCFHLCSLSSAPALDVVFKLQPSSLSVELQRREGDLHLFSQLEKDLLLQLNVDTLKMQVTSSSWYCIAYCTNGRSNITSNCRQILYFL